MRYDLFAYKRDMDSDYRWHLRTETMPSSFYHYMQRFIELRESTSQIDLDWNKLIFLMNYENKNMACRILEAGQDYVGRVIYSLEGLVSEDYGIRSICRIPDLVKAVYDMPAFAEAEPGIAPVEFIEVEDTINPLLPMSYNRIPEELNCPGFQELIYDSGHHNLAFAAVVGPNASQLMPYLGGFSGRGEVVFARAYDICVEVAQEMENTQTELGTPVEMPTIQPGEGLLEYPCLELPLYEEGEAKGEGKELSLFLKFHKEGLHGGSYEWVLQRTSDGSLLRGSKRKFAQTVSISQLVMEEAMIKNYYALLGFQVR